MTNALLPVGKAKFWAQDGTPLALGKVYFYEAGSLSVLQDTYADEQGNATNTNPVVLDAYGEANIWLAPLLYQMKVTDANDVQQYVTDDVSAIGTNTQATATTFGLVKLAVEADYPADVADDTLATTPAYVEAAKQIHSFTAKTAMVAADEMGISDSEAGYVNKRITLANLETQLETDLESWVNGLITAGGGSGSGGTGSTPPAFSNFVKTTAASFVAGTVLTTPHGLGAIPDIARCYLVCTATTFGYSVGQVVPVDAFYAANGGGRAFYFDATNFYFLHRLNSYGDVCAAATTSGGPAGQMQIDPTKWQVYFVGAIVNTGGTIGSAFLGSGSIDTSSASGLLDLRTIVTNDVYSKIIIEIDDVVTTGATASAGGLILKFAQQGSINSSSNYNSSINAGSANNFTGNFNQAAQKITTTPGGSVNISDGSGTLTLYGFCKTTRKPPWVDASMLVYASNASITSEIGYGYKNTIWGSGGDDTKITDGLAFSVSNVTKYTFNYRVYGVK